MASIHKKGNKFYISINYNNKQIWLPGRDTKSETIGLINNIIYNYFFKDSLNNSKNIFMTKDFLNFWINSYARNNLTPTTIAGYKT